MQGEYPNFWREKVPGNPEDRTLLQGTADFLSLRGFDRKGTIQRRTGKSEGGCRGGSAAEPEQQRV